MSLQPEISATAPKPTIEEALEHAKRAFALQKYEQAVDHYATALELMTAKHGEKAPETADLYFSYGKALLENAIAQSSVLGKEQTEDTVQAAVGDAKTSGTSGTGAFLSFSGDADDTEDMAVDLFAEAEKAVDEMDKEEEEDDDDDEGEPEDDFNAAWEVLDLARAIYEEQQDEDDRIKLRLADTYIALGDVSLETEKFDQAITDYRQGLELKNTLLPFSSRQIAEAHYKLSIVLDLTSGQLNDAIEHAEKALGSVEARLAELRDILSGQGLVTATEEKPDVKGKSKATGPSVLADDAIQIMGRSQMESEVKELNGLKEDLALKVEELKMPQEPVESAPAMAAKALDRELNPGASVEATTFSPTVVNDLTGIVKKKKKASEANEAVKRKAEEEAGSSTEKKAKVDGANS
ncbi:NASP-related protein [Sparassis crispa]|uniref:NASP-related protein n=1 Tax=Sparassis crispa TaxID=139825 RepID=A0A401GVJ1_9APHY|nr:NASP-related protein [Sparassis crispa]GBE86247.1 NASP-related protein [Sparassis crispa]